MTTKSQPSLTNNTNSSERGCTLLRKIASSENEGTFIPRSTSRLVTVVELERTYPTEDPLEDTSMDEGKNQLLNNNTPTAIEAKTLLQLRY